MANYVCGDNRFEIIERYKKELTSATNIEGSPDEMAVLDNILFRFWQMGWLKEQKTANLYKCPNCGTWVSAENVVRCKDCKYGNLWLEENVIVCDKLSKTRSKNWFCADGERL